MGSDSRFAAATAFASFVAVQVTLAVAFKAAQRADGSYAFSPPLLLVASEAPAQRRGILGAGAGL